MMTTLIACTLILALAVPALLLVSKRRRNWRQFQVIAESVGIGAFKRPPPGRLNCGSEMMNGLIDSLARSAVTVGVLGVVAHKQKPVPFSMVVRNYRASHQDTSVPLTAIRMVLNTLLLCRFIRSSRAGFEITELGRDVYRLIEARHASSRGRPAKTIYRTGKDIIPIRQVRLPKKATMLN